MKQICHKLVRDRIPQIVAAKSKGVACRTLTANEHKKELIKKLFEEAEELKASVNNREQLTEEIADVCEVLDGIVEAYGLDKASVIELKLKKKLEKGGFEEKVFLEYIEE